METAETQEVKVVATKFYRLRPAEEQALNVLLERRGGSFEGKPWFRISWAADDNRGMRKKHEVGCPRTDPFDHNCSCPTEIDPRHTPICFDPNQTCYHLLYFRPPSFTDKLLASETGDDLSHGIYECTGLHFVDPETNGPINPTASILELILPTLEFLGESAKAAAFGVNAVLNRERQKRKERYEEKQRRKEARADAFADALLRDATPAFGGSPHTGYGTKTKLEGERTTGDVTTPSPGDLPEFGPPLFTQRMTGNSKS